MKNKSLYLLLIGACILIFTLVLRIKTNNALPFYDQYSNDRFLELFHLDTIFFRRIIPFIFGIINILLLYLISKKITENAFIMSLLWVVSPVFIYFHSSYNTYPIALTLFLSGLILLLSNKYLISGCCLFVSVLINQNMFLIVLLALLIILEKDKKKFLISAVGIISVSYLYSTLNNADILAPHQLITWIFADFGADFGLGIFLTILSFIGLLVSWKDKNSNYIIYLTILSLGVLTLFEKDMLLFLDIILVYYAALALKALIKRKWESETLKTYVIIIFICGIIFSTGAYIKKVSVSAPDQGELISLGVLKKEGIVFSHYKFGFMINKISGLQTYTDSDYYKKSKDREKIIQSEKIFSSRDFKEIDEFFQKNNIKYIWTNEEMKSGLVWHKEDEGMLLVLKNNFKRIYNYRGIEIWESSS